MLVMSEPITRLYDKKKSATDAVADLKKSGFPGELVTLVSPPDSKAAVRAEAGSDDGIVAALEKAGISKSAAAVYAERVRGGGSVVSITPNWGTARRAIAILDKYGPIEAGIPEEAPGVSSAGGALGLSSDSEVAAPLSTRIGWQVLIHSPTPLSSYFKWSVLSDKTAYFTESAKVSELSENPTPLSSWLKWPVLSDKSTPFSNWLNRPVLSEKATPFSDWAKWPVLSDKATPLSTWLNFRVLS
jgi:hypothetical protein